MLLLPSVTASSVGSTVIPRVSSSAMLSSAAFTVRSPAVPPTVSVSSSSSTPSSSGVSVNVAVPVVAPEPMVSVMSTVE